ncbi:MAG TPA: diadenylate cyclase CdaA, partial [Roseiflexaceae bacterium]|nr:diadenylate cyclase CdaA [Roseiflexaceae bacterium]
MSDILRLLERLNPLVDPLQLLDIAIVSLIFFWLLGVIRGTRAVQLLRGIGIVLAISIVLGSTLELATLNWLLVRVLQPALIVAIPVLFQPELRRALETLGRTNDLFGRPFGRTNRSELVETISGVARAAQQLSQQGIGALMVIERETRLQDYADRGVILDSRLAVPLLLNIFYPNSPRHDMAVIVRGNRILAANVVLPLSEDVVGQRRYGTRHRAAKGISEQSDAIAVVVS